MLKTCLSSSIHFNIKIISGRVEHASHYHWFRVSKRPPRQLTAEACNEIHCICDVDYKYRLLATTGCFLLATKVLHKYYLGTIFFHKSANHSIFIDKKSLQLLIDRVKDKRNNLTLSRTNIQYMKFNTSTPKKSYRIRATRICERRPRLSAAAPEWAPHLISNFFKERRPRMTH
jgi:hypothetical protein